MLYMIHLRQIYNCLPLDEWHVHLLSSLYTSSLKKFGYKGDTNEVLKPQR